MPHLHIELTVHVVYFREDVEALDGFVRTIDCPRHILSVLDQVLLSHDVKQVSMLPTPLPPPAKHVHSHPLYGGHSH